MRRLPYMWFWFFLVFVLAFIRSPSLISLAQTVPPPTRAAYLPLISNFIPSPTPTFTVTPTPTQTPRATETNTPVPPIATKTPPPVAEVAVVSSNMFYPAFDISTNTYLVGEVINRTGQNVRFVKINAVLRDAAGKIIDGSESYAEVETLSPNMTSGFLIIFLDPPTYHSSDITVTWDTSPRGPYELKVTGQEIYFDSSDAFHVRGNVTNQSSDRHTFVKVFLVLYNKSNQVIGVSNQYLNPSDLNAGQTVPFDAKIFFWRGKPDQSQIGGYSVHAYDD